MDEEKIKEVKNNLKEINKFIATLDPAIRQPAFEKLAPLYFAKGGAPAGKGSAAPGQGGTPDHLDSGQGDQEEFFRAHPDKEAHENVYLISAWFYSRYGISLFTNNEIKEIAKVEGLSIPDRPDMTLKSLKHDGKPVFRRKGKAWQPTVQGEAYLRENFGVTMGRNTKPDDISK